MAACLTLGLLGHVNGFSKGSSRVRVNSHARFLGGRRLVTVAAYPIRILRLPISEQLVDIFKNIPGIH